MCGLMFLGVQVIYYEAVLNISSVGDTARFNQMLLGVSEGCSYIAAEIFIPYLPRRLFSFIGLGLSGALCLGIALLTILADINVLEIILLFSMRFVSCMFWAALYVYMAELFPTRVRSLAFGWASAVGTIGSSLVPFLVLAVNEAGLNQWILPGALGLISAACAIWLPETLNKPMSEEIYEKKKSTIVKMTLRSEAKAEATY
jgi:OCT family organic cation transporter-like MFS transporter 4/5